MQPRKPKRRIWPWLSLGLLALAAWALFDLEPLVPEARQPSAAEAHVAQKFAQRLGHFSAGASTTEITAGPAEVAALSTVGAWFKRPLRGDVSLGKQGLAVRYSQPLGPLWLNLRGVAQPGDGKLPDVRLHIGRLPLGKTLSRWALQRALGGTVARQYGLFGIEGLIEQVRIAPDKVRIVLRSGAGGLGSMLAAMGGTPSIPAETVQVYCALVRADRDAPEADFAKVVRRAFALPAGSLPQDANRARFVALAIYVAGEPALQFAGKARGDIEACGSPATTALLRDRYDLPRHWAVSAALAAAAGNALGSAIGEFKELADSRSSGSGFSFIDLAANRAGLAAGRQGSDPSTAGQTATRLARATQDSLLPIAALAQREGMREKDWLARYETFDSREFAKAAARIDAVLAGQEAPVR